LGSDKSNIKTKTPNPNLAKISDSDIMIGLKHELKHCLNFYFELMET